MKYFVYNDPDWSYVGYDWDGFEKDAERVAQTLNATDPDLSAFRERGGKLLIYNGWSDNAQTSNAFVDYYEEVLTEDETAADDVRMFLMPGVEHCFPGSISWEKSTTGWSPAMRRTRSSRIGWTRACSRTGPGRSALIRTCSSTTGSETRGMPRASAA